MRVTNMRRGLVALAAALLLTGCSNDGELIPDVKPFSLKDIDQMDCDLKGEMRDARDFFDKAVNADEDSLLRKKLEDWDEIDYLNEDQINQAIADLDGRIEACDNEDDGTAAEPSESPTDDGASPGTTDDDSDEQVTYSDIVGWYQLVQDPPSGLRKVITANTSTAGFGWSDVRAWADTTMPRGANIDARIAVVFGRPGLTDIEVRGQTGVDNDVPVVRATRCYTVVDSDDTVCPTGDERLTVVLSPVVINGGKVAGLATESGVLLAGDLPLVTYDLR